MTKVWKRKEAPAEISIRGSSEDPVITLGTQFAQALLLLSMKFDYSDTEYIIDVGGYRVINNALLQATRKLATDVLVIESDSSTAHELTSLFQGQNQRC
jgi:hypothetical protein